jgi:hypothetical protein
MYILQNLNNSFKLKCILTETIMIIDDYYMICNENTLWYRRSHSWCQILLVHHCVSQLDLSLPVHPWLQEKELPLGSAPPPFTPPLGLLRLPATDTPPTPGDFSLASFNSSQGLEREKK